MKPLTLLAAITFAACTDDAATGKIMATAYGEAYIEDGIPAAEVSDGWAIAFDAFTLSIGGTAAQAGEGGGEVGDEAMHTVDLALPTGGAGTELATYAAPAGTYDHYGYRVEAIRVVGSGTKAGVTKAFDWTFAMKLAFAHCEMNVAIDGQTVEMQSTIHADHLFYDDAISPEPDLAFDIFAASDGDANGAVTLDELAAKDITTESRYQVGSLTHPVTGAAIDNLRQYVELQVTTLGHINGEGHCEDVIVQP